MRDYPSHIRVIRGFCPFQRRANISHKRGITVIGKMGLPLDEERRQPLFEWWLLK
jgi:hypothetical protein